MNTYLTNKKEKQLERTLYNLGKKCIEFLDKQKKCKRYTLIKRVIPTGYQLTKYGTIDFSKGGVSLKTELVKKPMFNIQELIKNTEEFKATIGVLRSINLEVDPLKTLESFCRLITIYLIKGEDLQKIIKDIIITFKRELHNLPINWLSIIKLKNVLISKPILIIDKSLKFRQLKEDELIIEENVEYGIRRDLHDLPDSICELKSLCKLESQAQRDIHKLITILRLFRPSCADYESYRIFGYSTKWVGGRLFSNRRISSEPKLILTENDLVAFRKFYYFMREQLDHVLGEAYSELFIALKRYEESLLSTALPEERLTKAVMALESLYLKENQGITQRFALRISKIMSLLNEKKPQGIYNLMKEVYRKRSEYIHGKILDSKSKDKINKELLPKTWEILRKSIILFIVLKEEGYEKKKLLERVDASLIDNRAEQKLRNILSKYEWLFT